MAGPVSEYSPCNFLKDKSTDWLQQGTTRHWEGPLGAPLRMDVVKQVPWFIVVVIVYLGLASTTVIAFMLSVSLEKEGEGPGGLR